MIRPLQAAAADTAQAAYLNLFKIAYDAKSVPHLRLFGGWRALPAPVT